MIKINGNVQRLVAIVAAILSAMALSMPGTIVEGKGFAAMLLGEVDGVGLLSFIVAVALSIWYWKNWDVFSGHKHWTIHVLASLFSVFTLIGKSYTQLGNWDFIFYNGRQFVIAVIAFIGHFILFEFCICGLFRFLDSKKIFFCNSNTRSEKDSLNGSKYFLFSFIIISLCWLPFLIIYLPGSVPHDGYQQINMAFGIVEFSDNHPWAVTLFMGALMRIGRVVSDNFGVFLVVITFYVLEALCYSIICYKIRKWKAPRLFYIAVLLFFSVVPVFGAYAQALIKDGIFMAFVALFITLYTECCLSCLHIIPKIDIKKQMCFLFIVGFIVCLTRKNGIYMVLPADVLLCVFFDKGKKRVALLLSALLALSYFSVNEKIPAAIGIEPGSVKEMLSIPFQQTARYLKEYPDDITEEEAEAIEKVLRLDVGERYFPEVSDPVKNTFHSGEEDLAEYFKVWRTMFWRHPGVYLEATIHNAYGYYYPFYNFSRLQPYQFYIKGEPIATGDFDIHYIMPEKLRNWMANYAMIWRNMPGLAQLLNPGFYSWVLLLICGYTVYSHRYKRMLLFVTPLLNIVIYIASPVNGFLRYAMPLLACMPVLIFFCLADGHGEVLK